MDFEASGQFILHPFLRFVRFEHCPTAPSSGIQSVLSLEIVGSP